MEKRIAAFTIFTFLLFAVSTARIALDPDVYKSSTKSEQTGSELDQTTANDQLTESEQTQTFDVRTIDLTPRLIFSRSVPIQRHSFDRSTRIPLRFVQRHPCRKFKKTFMIPTKMSYGNDMILSDKTTSVDLGDLIPTKRLEFNDKYGHHHHHHHDEDEKFEMKRAHKGGFMRRFRKFLKHTFD